MTSIPDFRSTLGIKRRDVLPVLYLNLIFLILTLLVPAGRAFAVPSFAQQTGQPCAACHVGAFGPQLKQFGRDFKLNGYTATDGQNHFPPLSVTTYGSFTHTNNAQPVPPATSFGTNNNFALDQTSLYYAGKIYGDLGAFIQITFDGTAYVLQADNADIRYAHDSDLFDEDWVYGFTVNNSPTVTDLWNSTPTWGFPYNSSKLVPTPLAATLIDGGLAQRVIGGGVYTMWNDLIYFETDVYGGLGYSLLNATGNVPVAGTDTTAGAIPYWRLALQKDFGRSYAEFGTYGLHANVMPGGIDIPGYANAITDTALDANYQFTFNPKNVTSDMISAHATVIHESGNLAASQLLAGANPSSNLTTFRADVSYSIGATVTPTIQYFQTTGSTNANYWTTPNGSPNSNGVIAEIAYVPWGKPDSFISWGNVRFAAQYITYFHFNGTTAGASANNTLYLSVWFAAHF